MIISINLTKLNYQIDPIQIKPAKIVTNLKIFSSSGETFSTYEFDRIFRLENWNEEIGFAKKKKKKRQNERKKERK